MEKKRVVYGVFETFAREDDIDQDEYLIYKLDVDSADDDDDVRDLGQPIYTLKLKEYPSEMSVISSGSKFYFIGGFELELDEESKHVYWTNKAYMFDVSSSPNVVIPIESMASPKPSPLVFGPVNDHKFYVFSGNAIPPSFEMLDTRSNTWKTLALPPFFSQIHFNACSLLWGDTHILLSNTSKPYILAYSTKNDNWRIISDLIPFIDSRPLFSQKDTCHVFLATDRSTVLPVLYMSVVNHDKELDPVGHFERLDEVVGLRDITLKKPRFPKGWGDLQNFFTFKDDDINYICIVRCAYSFGIFKKAYEPRPEDAHHIIDICNFTYTLLESTKVKEVKVENSWKFKYCKKMALTPKWFFAV